MEIPLSIEAVQPGVCDRDPHQWLAKVLTTFAHAEQALGRLCLSANLGIEKGTLTSLGELRRRMANSGDPRCRALENRIARWQGNRPFRHLLAHATLHILTDAGGHEILVTRHLPRDLNDITPDLMWLPGEREELLRQVSNDSRSIADQVSNILGDPALLNRLRATVVN